MLTKALDERQTDLLHGLAQPGARARGRGHRPPDLSHRESVGHRLGTQPQIDREPRHLLVPDIPLQAVGHEAPGARELGSERFIEGHAVQCTDERSGQLGDEQPVARMPAIARRQELDVGLRDRRDELRHALRARGGAGRVQHDDGPGLCQLRRGEHGAERRVLAGQAMVRRNDAMQCAQRMRRLHHVGLAECRVPNQVGRPVGRAAVRVDHDGAKAREIAREAHVRGADNRSHRLRVVEGRQSDQDIDLAHGHQLPQQCVRKRAWVLHGLRHGHG